MGVEFLVSQSLADLRAEPTATFAFGHFHSESALVPRLGSGSIFPSPSPASRFNQPSRPCVATACQPGPQFLAIDRCRCCSTFRRRRLAYPRPAERIGWVQGRMLDRLGLTQIHQAPTTRLSRRTPHSRRLRSQTVFLQRADHLSIVVDTAFLDIDAIDSNAA